MSLLALSDSYKYSHWKQYPEGTTNVYSYLESRGGKFDETVFFGLQWFLRNYLIAPITKQEIDIAEEMVNKHIGPGIFNRAGWDHILKKHGGKLPVRIRAVKEGTVVPVSNALMTIENTDPEVPWLTNFLETLLLQVWYPTTVATLSRECKKIISDSLKKSAVFNSQDEFEGCLNFRLHDFGFRGVSSVESAALGGLAHLVNFLGTDTFVSLMSAKDIYGEDCAGFSIPASEHSTITSWGKDGEIHAFKNMLDKYPNGLVACVSDSFDITEAVETLWPSLKDQIMEREGTLVVRPDSGDIKMTLQVVLNGLWKHFGGTTNSEGYRVLDSHVRVIQGDGMNYESLKETLDYIMQIGFSTENVAFGMGGALLQKLDRDTQKFAFKCSAIKVDDEWRGVYKSPTELDEEGNKTSSFKKSKLGRFSLVRGTNGIETIQYNETLGGDDLLQTVFENGEIKENITLTEARKNARVI